MVENKENKYNTIWSPSFADANGTIGTDFKWSGKEDTELQREVISALSKIRKEREKAEQKIYEVIKSFEWSTGIKIIKLDFEMSKDKFNPRVKLVLDRI